MEDILQHLSEGLVILNTVLAFLIPFSIYTINQLIHEKGDPPWKKEDKRQIEKKKKSANNKEQSQNKKNKQTKKNDGSNNDGEGTQAPNQQKGSNKESKK